MGIKKVLQSPYSLDLSPCDFCLFPKLRGCRYETIEEMKEAMTKVIDTLTQEDFHGALQKLLERYKVLSNFEVQMDYLISARRPDLVIMSKKRRERELNKEWTLPSW